MSLDATVSADLSLAAVSPRDAAVFLEFDGVLVDLARNPGAVHVPDGLVALLAVLEAETAGACAIVSGRAIADLRRHLPVIPQAVIGSHGAECQLPGAPAYRHAAIGSARVAHLHATAARAGLREGIEVEAKPAGVALHHHDRPEHGDTVLAFANALVTEVEGFVTRQGRSVVEILPEDVAKDQAVAWAMTLPRFAARRPVCFADGLIDTPLLDWVQALGGVAVRVGGSDDVGQEGPVGPAEVQAVLAHWLEDQWVGA